MQIKSFVSFSYRYAIGRETLAFAVYGKAAAEPESLLPLFRWFSDFENLIRGGDVGHGGAVGSGDAQGF